MTKFIMEAYANLQLWLAKLTVGLYNLRGIEWLSYHRKLSKQRGKYVIGVIGDSHAQFFPEHPDILNLGVGGDSVADIQWRVEHGALDNKSVETMYILCGVNDIFQGKEPYEVAHSIGLLYNNLYHHPKIGRVEVILIPKAKGGSDNFNINAKIDYTNLLLRSAHMRCTEILIYGYQDDGLHLNEETYNEFLEERHT